MKTLLPLLGALLLVTSACNEDTAAPAAGFDATAMLADVPTKVILATYQDLEAKAVALRTAVNTFNGAPTDPNLTAALDAWRAARRPWEQAEGFLFGPVETQGIDPAIDSWPVNRVDLDAVLASAATLNQAYIDGLEGTLKGFHTIEYLLFGTTGTKVAADFTAREREYLVGSTASLAAAVTTLRAAWDPAGGNYAHTVSSAGAAGNAVYISQSAAMQELINGMIVICDEVANGKISGPFDQQDRSLEESQFSNNSNRGFRGQHPQRAECVPGQLRHLDRHRRTGAGSREAVEPRRHHPDPDDRRDHRHRRDDADASGRRSPAIPPRSRRRARGSVSSS